MRGDLIVVLNILMRESRGAGANLFMPMISDRTQGNIMKLRRQSWIAGKGFSLNGRAPEQAPQGSSHRSSLTVQEVFSVIPGVP